MVETSAEGVLYDDYGVSVLGERPRPTAGGPRRRAQADRALGADGLRRLARRVSAR